MRKWDPQYRMKPSTGLLPKQADFKQSGAVRYQTREWVTRISQRFPQSLQTRDHIAPQPLQLTQLYRNSSSINLLMIMVCAQLYRHQPVNFPEQSSRSSSMLSWVLDGSDPVKSFFGIQAGVPLNIRPVSGDALWDCNIMFTLKLHKGQSLNSLTEKCHKTHLCGGSAPEGCQIGNGWDEVKDVSLAALLCIHNWCGLSFHHPRKLVWWDCLQIWVSWNIHLPLTPAPAVYTRW